MKYIFGLRGHDIGNNFEEMCAKAKENGISSLANMIIVGHLLENHPELSFEGTDAVVEKLVPPKKAALVELNKKALNLGKNYK
jgi:2-oxoglutarate ferredoxin oxidoreductase subunit gamma